ncbi:MAG: Holliday junction branch migration protein RuvA [Clostridia bacterium]|nr:Holliday junction branch migration protein RuvA [Clostridia bacterium]
MYSFISGIIEEKTENYVVVNANGVGYEIYISTNTLSNLPTSGDYAKVYTYLQVREDGMQLFGFASKEEKDVFLQLITVSGVGPKMALVILSSLSVQNLITCIVAGDVKTLSGAKGVGKKTAERIILELKGKMGDLGSTMMSDYTMLTGITSTACDEATELLVNMGLSKFDALKLVKKVAIDGDTTEVIIQKALKNMN